MAEDEEKDVKEKEDEEGSQRKITPGEEYIERRGTASRLAIIIWSDPISSAVKR